MSKELVLVTGATGFVGSHITCLFVEAGYRVRATFRSDKKMKEFEEINPSCKGKIEWVEVRDGAAPGAYNEAIKDVVYCIHTITFFFSSPADTNPADNERDILIPHLTGMKAMLEAAKTQSSIKHMVFTSSVAAVCDFNKGLRPGYEYSEKDWNPTTYEEAKVSPSPVFVYCAGKTLSERLVWDDSDRKFAFTSICPAYVYGPAIHPVNVLKERHWFNSTKISKLLNGNEEDYVPPTDLPFNLATHVRDVAELHLKAITDSRLINKRCLVNGFSVYNTEWTNILRKIFADEPKLLARIPTKPGKDIRKDKFTIDNSFSKEILGREYISLEIIAKDTALSILEHEARSNNVN